MRSSAFGLGFLHYVNSVADALRMAAFDGRADMKQIFRRDQLLRQLTGMQSDVDFGIKAVKEIQHAHVRVEVMNGHVRSLQPSPGSSPTTRGSFDAISKPARIWAKTTSSGKPRATW